MRKSAWLCALILVGCQSLASAPTETPTPSATPTSRPTVAAFATSITATYTATPAFYTEFALPAGAIHKMGDFRLADGNAVRGIGWSADSRKLALGMGYGDAVLWSLDINAPEMVIKLVQGGATDLHWDDDRGILRTVENNPELGGGTVAMYYGPSSEVLIEPPMPDRVPAAWSPDGSQYVFGEWDASTSPRRLIFKSYRAQQRIKLWERVLGGASSAVYSPDSSRIAVPDPSAGEIYILNASDGETITTLFTPMADDPCLVWSPDGKLIAVADTERVLVLDARDGGGMRQLLGGCAIAFSPDSRIVATSMDTGAINLWEWESGERVSLEGHSDAVLVMRFSPDGTMLASSSVDGTLVIWDVTNVP